MAQGELKVPPHDLEAEAAILGALMLDEQTVWAVMPKLKPNDFFVQKHRIILDAMYDIAENGDGKIDVISLRSALDYRDELGLIGGVTYLSGLIDALPDVANVQHYVGIVREHSLDRRLKDLGRSLSGNGVRPRERAEIVLAKMHMALCGEEATGIKSMAQLAREYVANQEAGITTRCASTGLSVLDNKMIIRRGNVVVVAGHPGTGKSSLAVQAAIHVAKEGRVLLITLEMSAEEMVERVVQSMTGASAHIIDNPQFTNQDNRDKIKTALMEVGRDMETLHVLSPGNVTPQDVIAHSRAIEMQHGELSLVVVDYLQLMHCPERGLGTVERVTWLSRHLKAAARQLSVPLMVLSQLSRDSAKGNREPELHDLRDSGAIEQDADIVVFTHRPDIETDDGMLLVKKQRHGALGRCRVKYDGSRCRFLTIQHSY